MKDQQEFVILVMIVFNHQLSLMTEALQVAQTGLIKESLSFEGLITDF